jgi:hypothetical protein
LRLQHFARFCADVTPHAQSFNQLLHNQERVLGIILDHLAVPNSMCIEPLLECVRRGRPLTRGVLPFVAAAYRVYGCMIWPHFFPLQYSHG